MPDIIKKHPDVERVRYSFETKGNKIVKQEKKIVLKNCYILIKENGDSFVGTAEEFKRLGIELPKEVPTTTTQTPPQV